MTDDKRQKGILRLRTFAEQTPDSKTEFALGKRMRLRSLEQLEPLARSIARNQELMKRFQDVMGCDDEDRARAMVDDVRNIAHSIDSELSYAEGASISIILMRILREQQGFAETGSP
jgi:hypothetical protein